MGIKWSPLRIFATGSRTRLLGRGARDERGVRSRGNTL